MRQPVIDMTGKVFGWLTVLRRAGSVKRRGIKKQATWLCRCSCGCEVVVNGNHLRAGRHKSCARNGHRWVANKGRREGPSMLYPNEYCSWRGMFERCNDERRHNYRHYAGRGIKVCERWLSFKNFLEDMGPRPPGHFSIDRINNDGDYEPGNCRWATRSQQRRNMQNNLYVEHEGKRLLLCELVEQLNLDYAVVKGRLNLGWSLDEALTKPVRKRLPYSPRSKKPPLKPIATPWDMPCSGS